MATVLLAWELGGGLGHLMNLLPTVKGLCEREHRVVAALKDLSKAKKFFLDLPVEFLQAPVRTAMIEDGIPSPRTFAHILYNCGFNDFNELHAMASAWRGLFTLVRPDLTVFDHCPTGLLGSQGLPMKRALSGTGFCAPPDVYPLPDLRPWLEGSLSQMQAEEDRVLENANRVLASWNLALMERISQLYARVDENFLGTFPELDPYGPRQGIEYWGGWPNFGGKTPEWPEGPGKRVFFYMNCSIPNLPGVLMLLYDRKCPTIFYGNAFNEKIREQYQTPFFCFEQQRLDMAAVGKQCDLAILHGGQGSTASMLLAGKPILEIPIVLEQYHNALAVEKMGAGLKANQQEPECVQRQLRIMLGEDKFKAGAEAFSRKYADFRQDRQIERMMERMESLLRS
jgi:hypothetical protein